jgi:hypothetical protein
MLKPREQTLKMLRIVGEEHICALLQEDGRRRVEKQRIEQNVISQREATLRRLHIIERIVPCGPRT